MTTDEAQQAGERRTTTTSDDDFSSENYVTKPSTAPPTSVDTDQTNTDQTNTDQIDTVILGTVPGEFRGSTEMGTTAESESESATAPEQESDVEHDPEHEVEDDVEHEIVVEDDAEADDTNNDTTGEEPGERDDDGSGEAVMAAGGSGETTGHESAATTGETETGGEPAGSHLEMRQVAGLTAGSMMKLTMGRAFEFNESNEGGSFSLRVLENGEVIVHPGSAHAVLDEVEVDEPMLIGEALLNVSSACFSVRRPRPPASRESRMESIGAAFASISAISVPALGAEQPLAPDQLTGSRLGTIINRNPLTRGAIGQKAWDFLQSIRQTRSVVAERHRLLHPDPEELKTRLSRLDPGLWERSREHPLFGRFGVGYANIPWEPRFDNPELIPEILHEPIVEMSLLPWVPVTANLLYGPLGIVGKRAARLAACRHAILSLSALSMPGEVQFAIRSGKNTATSWSWARALPAIMSVDDDSPFVITVIDGADGARVDEAARQAAHEEAIKQAGSATAAVEVDLDAPIGADPQPTGEVPVVEAGGVDADTIDLRDVAGDDEEPGFDRAPTSGHIVLADSVDELTQPCGTVLQIESDGTGSVTNHLNETIQVTPIGVTEAFAHDMATRIADILTNSFL